MATDTVEGTSLPACWWRVRQGALVLAGSNDAARRLFGERIDGLVGREAAEALNGASELLGHLEGCARQRDARRALITISPRPGQGSRRLAILASFLPPDTVLMCVLEPPLPEEAQRAAEDQLREVVAKVPVLLWSADACGKVLRAEGSGLAALGLRTEDVVGHNGREILADHPEALGYFERALAGETVDSTVEWRGRFLNFRNVPSRGEGGVVERVSGVAVDVTERVQAEGKLRTIEERMRHVFASIPAMVHAVDRSSVITMAEGGALVNLGLTPTEVVGKTLQERSVSPETVEHINRALAGETLSASVTYQGRVLDHHFFPERDAKGEIVGAICLSLDVTEKAVALGRLRAAERRLHQVLANAPLILFGADREGKITFHEGAGQASLGLRDGEMVGWSVFDLNPDPQSRERINRALSGESVAGRCSVRGRTLDFYYVPDRNEADEVVGIAGLAMDVTERVRTEATLEATATRLQRVVSTAPVLLWAHDSAGVITLAEGKGFAALGQRPEEMVGMKAHQLYPDRPEALAAINGVLAGQPFSGRVKARSRTFEAHFFPEYDETGTVVVGGSGMAFDVTERIRSEEELRASEERFRRFAEHVREGFWIATPDLGEIVYTNPALAAILGGSGDSVKSLSAWQASVHPEDRERMAKALQAWLGGDTDNTYRIVRPDGSVRWVRGRSFPIRDASGRIAYVAGLVEDTTDERRIEDEVRRIQDRLADAQRVAHVGNWDWDVPTDALRVSEETYRIFGLQAAGRTMPFAEFRAVVHPEDQEAFGEAVNASHAHGSLLDVTHRVLRPDATVRVVRSRGEVTFDASGRPARMIGTVQDVTESQDAERALAILSNAVAQTADLVFITDRDGRLEYVNPAFEAHTGFTREEALGATPRILKSEHTSPEEHALLWQTILDGKVFRGVLKNRKKGGDFYFEEKTIAPIRDPQGRITHFVSVGRDITARKRAEEVQERLQDALRKSAHEWKSTFDAVESPLVLCDALGVVRRLNRVARDLWGGTYEEIVGSPLSDRVDEPWSTMHRAVTAVAARGTSVSLPTVRKERGPTWDVAASSMVGPDPGLGVIVLAKDITAIVDLQESLRRSESMSSMGALVAGVAHEVRNPLFGISAALDAFENEFGDRGEFGEYASRLRHEVGRLSALMHDLLEYGRPSTPQLAEGRIEDVIHRALRSVTTLARGRGVALRVDIPGELPPILMEASRMVQVFENLIENAIQHSHPGGEVSVQARGAATEEGTGVECVVSDSGPGFGTEDLPRVLEPFFTRRRGGFGLGLSIVHKIVGQHGGTIAMGNRAEGGARVVVTLRARELGPGTPA